MATRADEKADRRTAHAALLAAARIRFRPVRVSLAYQLGLAVVAVAMLLLPVVYLSLIGALAVGTWYYATHTSYDWAGANLYSVTAWAAPIFAGIAGVLFMVKPIFARRPKPPAPVTLDPVEEPTLHGFVERLCRAIGAPPPREIHVDLTVNASASFRRGARSMLGRDLVLTVGLPLVAGLDVRQFAGVLAHEFGHFTQATAMRLSYVIGAVNLWFARVVYERDEWDLSLARMRVDSEVGMVSLVAALVSVCIWSTRRILWLLMHVGHGLSCYLMRQMEYNADAHQAQVAGRDAIREVLLRLALLEAAANVAEDHLRHLWSEGRAVSDLPSLVRLHAARLAQDAQGTARLEREVLEQKTGRFDTHPSVSDRVRHAERLGAAAAVAVTEQATVLFADFEALARDVTAEAYRKAFGEPAAQLAVVSSGDAAAGASRTWEGTDAASRLVFGTPLLRFGLAPGTDAPAALDSAASGIASLAEAHRQILSAWPAFPSLLPRYDKVLGRLRGSLAALALDDAGVPVDAAEFGLSPDDLDRLVAIAHEADDERLALRRELAPVFGAVRARVDAALALGVFPEIRGRLGSDAPAPEPVRAAAGALRAIEAVWPTLADLSTKCAHGALLTRWANAHAVGDRFAASASRLLREAYELLGKIFQGLNDTAYPFEHARGPISVARYVVPEPPPRDRAVLDFSLDTLQRLETTYQRCWGELALLVEEVERAAGLPALTLPSPEPKSEVHAGPAE